MILPLQLYQTSFILAPGKAGTQDGPIPKSIETDIPGVSRSIALSIAPHVCSYASLKFTVQRGCTLPDRVLSKGEPIGVLSRDAMIDVIILEIIKIGNISCGFEKTAARLPLLLMLFNRSRQCLVKTIKMTCRGLLVHVKELSHSPRSRRCRQGVSHLWWGDPPLAD